MLLDDLGELQEHGVNWLPWTVLNTSGLPRASASTSASAQKPASRVLDKCRATTYRLCQRMTGTKLRNPTAIVR